MSMLYSNYYASSRLFHGSFSCIMGTQLDVLLIGDDRQTLEDVWEQVTTELVRLEKMLNRFDPESEVSRINREAPLREVTVSDELWEILQDCRRYYILTEGYFDITLSDLRQASFREDANSLVFLRPDLHIDLGGYGKGYALKRMRQIISAGEVRNAFVNFGNSSVLGMGSHPHGDYWPVGLENPFTRQPVASVRLCDSSLSTSGNTPAHPRHILNPLTGEYTEERKMVSVVAPDPVDAEVLTTALMVAPEERGEELIKHFDINEKHIYPL